MWEGKTQRSILRSMSPTWCLQTLFRHWELCWTLLSSRVSIIFQQQNVDKYGLVLLSLGCELVSLSCAQWESNYLWHDLLFYHVKSSWYLYFYRILIQGHMEPFVAQVIFGFCLSCILCSSKRGDTTIVFTWASYNLLVICRRRPNTSTLN